MYAVSYNHNRMLTPIWRNSPSNCLTLNGWMQFLPKYIFRITLQLLKQLTSISIELSVRRLLVRMRESILAAFLVQQRRIFKRSSPNPTFTKRTKYSSGVHCIISKQHWKSIFWILQATSQRMFWPMKVVSNAQQIVSFMMISGHSTFTSDFSLLGLQVWRAALFFSNSLICVFVFYLLSSSDCRQLSTDEDYFLDASLELALYLNWLVLGDFMNSLTCLSNDSYLFYFQLGVPRLTILPVLLWVGLFSLVKYQFLASIFTLLLLSVSRYCLVEPNSLNPVLQKDQVSDWYLPLISSRLQDSNVVLICFFNYSSVECLSSNWMLSSDRCFGASCLQYSIFLYTEFISSMISSHTVSILLISFLNILLMKSLTGYTLSLTTFSKSIS